MAISLDSISQIPQAISDELCRFDRVLADRRLVEQLLENSNLRRLASALDDLCRAEGVTGYHFTRAVHEHIADRGLQLSRGGDRRRDFISEYGHLFSEAQRERIAKMWNGYFDESRDAHRDGRIWFCCTLRSLEDGDADRLLTFFGGESIYMPLTEDDEVAAVLRAIGQPLIVKAKLPGTKLHTFSEIPWGRVWLSTYHVSVNKEAQQHDVDAYVLEPVPRDQIVSIDVVRSWR